MPLALIIATGSLIGGSSAEAQTVSGQTTAVPDLSQYNCSTSASAGAQVLHIGQVITGNYYEWNETYGVSDGSKPGKLTCISLLKPDARALSAAEAQVFLAKSAAIGAPASATQNVSTENAQSAPTVDRDNARPEPRKHVKPPSTAQATEKTSGGAPLPPVPAQHRRDESDVSTTIHASSTGGVGQAQASTVAPDTRTDLSASAVALYPNNTLAELDVTYPDGEMFRCTATVVSPYVVLTAGHCIQNNDRGGYVTSVTVYPTQSQTGASATIVDPNGSNSNFANIVTTQGWTQISGPDSFEVTQYRYDLAAIEFKTPFTFTSTFMPVVYASTNTAVASAGYPGTVGTSSRSVYGQYASSGTEDSESLQLYRASDVREFSVYSSGGDSGSPFWTTDASGRPMIVGSLSYGDDTDAFSGGPWYDGWNESLLSSWVAWTPSAATTAQATTGLRVADVLSSTNTLAQSYIRFYNSGSTAGTATVTLADSSTGNVLATWTSPSIPAGAAPQYGVATMESQASQSFQVPSSYSLSIQPTFNGYLQHVLWNATGNVLINLSTCNTKSTTDLAVLTNVDSSLLGSNYQSLITLFNTGTAATTATVGLYDARSGTLLGSFGTSSIPANGQLQMTVAQMESAAHISPSGTEYQYVVKVLSSFSGYIQHVINGSALGINTDMTAVCTLSSS